MPDRRETAGYRPVDPEMVERMKSLVTQRTDEALNAQFGISYNCWRKLIAGQPLRASLLSRLQVRCKSWTFAEMGRSIELPPAP